MCEVLGGFPRITYKQEPTGLALCIQMINSGTADYGKLEDEAVLELMRVDAAKRDVRYERKAAQKARYEKNRTTHKQYLNVNKIIIIIVKITIFQF